MGGRSSSGDIVTHTGSAVVIYEDTLTYQLLWAKEFFLSNYATQNIGIVESIIYDLPTDQVILGTSQPVVIVKINGASGQILYKKNIFWNTSQMSYTVNLNGIAPIRPYGLIFIYIPNSDLLQYFIQVSASDLFSNTLSWLAFGY